MEPGEGFSIETAEQLFSGHVFDVERVTVRSPDDESLIRDVVRHPGSVAVLPLLGDDAVLIRQYRTPAGAAVLEIPAGTRDVDGEAPEETAARECAEEIGYRPATVRPLAAFYNSPGYTDEYTLLFVATDLVSVESGPVDHEEAHAEVVRMPFSEAVALARTGGIDDVKTMLALLLAAG